MLSAAVNDEILPPSPPAVYTTVEECQIIQLLARLRKFSCFFVMFRFLGGRLPMGDG